LNTSVCCVHIEPYYLSDKPLSEKSVFRPVNSNLVTRFLTIDLKYSV